MNDLMIFEGHGVELFELNGTVFFNPYHVGECLELTDSAVRMAMGNMNDKQVVKVKNSDVKNIDFRKLNNAGENFLTESGVYKLVFKSRKPNAEAFTDWLAIEVIPSIRKNGHYGKPMTVQEQIQLLAKGNGELSEKIEQVDKRIDTLERDMPLYGCEIEEVKNHVNRKGVDVLGGKQSEAYRDASIRGSVYSDIYCQLKREFGAVSSYKSIKRKYLADVHDFIDCYKLPRVLEDQINNANAQMSFVKNERSE